MCIVHVLHAKRWNMKFRWGGENYLEWRCSGSWADCGLWWRRLLGSQVAAIVMLLHFLFKDTSPSVFFFVVFFSFSRFCSVLPSFSVLLISSFSPSAPYFFLFLPCFFQFSHLSLFLFFFFYPSLILPPGIVLFPHIYKWKRGKRGLLPLSSHDTGVRWPGGH